MTAPPSVALELRHLEGTIPSRSALRLLKPSPPVRHLSCTRCWRIVSF